MNTTTTRCCAFCSEPGHDIRSCNDIRISNCWRDILCHTYIQAGSLLSDDDLEHVHTYIRTLDPHLVRVVAVQMGHCRSRDSLETQIDRICMSVYLEAARYEQLSLEEKREFLHWMDPENHPLEVITETSDDVDDLPDLITDDDYIPFNDDYQSLHLIEPLLLCLESVEELGKNSECPICFEEGTNLLDMDTTACQHSFCHSCIIKHLQTKPNCPMCRAPVNTLQVRHKDHYDEIRKIFGTIPVNRPLDNIHFSFHYNSDIRENISLPERILRRIRPIPLPIYVRRR